MNPANPSIEQVELELKIKDTELETQIVYVAGKFASGNWQFQKETSLSLQVTSRFHDGVKDEVTITMTHVRHGEPAWLLVPMNAEQAIAIGTEIARLGKLLLKKGT